MTLLELLVKELPDRGEWPERASHAGYNINRGGVYFTENGTPGFKGDILSIHTCDGAEEKAFWIPGVNFKCDEPEDYATAIVTREQYEAAIAVQQPAWNGEGLPPVGVKCKAKYNYASSAEWFLFECVGVSNGIAFGFADGAAVHLLGSEFTFRTETDRKRESAITSLLSLGVFTRPVAEKTIEAIEAGKIPGVKMIDVNVNK